MPGERKKVVALLSDLMFMVKIQEAAKRAGIGVTFVKSAQELRTEAKQAPLVIILDLNNSNLNPLTVIEELKGNEETRKISLLGFISHVQADLRRAAQEKGCDSVIARSVLSQNLPAILRRYAEAKDNAE